jgi:PKD repeat protein/glucose/arabinose dehydrogenase
MGGSMSAYASTQVTGGEVRAHRPTVLTSLVLLAAVVALLLPGARAAQAQAPVDSDFQQVTLAKGAGVLGEPMAIAVLPNRSVLSTARDGRVFHTTPDGVTTLAAQLPVYSHDEDGLQGIAIDPGFAVNNWVYLYYAPPLNTPAGDAPTTADGPAAFEPYKGHNLLSRFKLSGTTLDLSTEQRILEVPADRGICCHAGGEIDFDAAGNLYLSTGDDTNPFESEGYSPIDERSTRNPAFDAQRSSANTNDLRGKLLRISIQDDPATPAVAEYTSPAGNLYPEAEDTTDTTRPEIYAMGFRNPFRFAVDRATGDIMLGDYGPDAGAPSAFGPAGQVEFNLIKQPGNYGWPYCTGDNSTANTYTNRTFTGAGLNDPAGAKFDCQAPVNDSPRNTGRTQLPPAQAAWIFYDDCSVPEFGCGSESPMGGPTYRYDAALQSDTKFPQYYDGKMFIYEWGRGWIKTVTANADGTRGAIEPFFDSMSLTRPMALEFGPEGSLYVLDYGGGFFFGDENSGLYRIDYVQGKRAPIAVAKGTPDSGVAPLTVQFSSAGSQELDTGDQIVSYEWDFQNDGTVDSTAQDPAFTYTQNGDYTARLTVTDTTGKTGTATVPIAVGNTRPQVQIELPPNGGFFEYGDPVRFKVTVTDPEDGTIDCTKVRVDTSLGHNDHAHGDQSFTACEGTVTIPAAWEDETQYSTYIVSASYTDAGGAPGTSPLTGTAQAILQPKLLQAEFFSTQSGVNVFQKGPASGGRAIGDIHAGDWISFAPVNFLNIGSLTYRVASAGQGGVIEARLDAPDGPLLASTAVSPTGGWETFVSTAPTPITDPGGTHRLFLVFQKPAGSTSTDALFDIDAIGFHGKGVATTTRPDVTLTSPTNGQQFASGAAIPLAAEASDAENAITTVEFFADGVKVGEATQAPYSATWTGAPDGFHTLTARATNDKGLARTSAPVDIVVGDLLVKDPWKTFASTTAEFFQFGANEFVIDANGADTWTDQDEYGAIYQDAAVTDRFVATVKVNSQENTNDWAKAGIMVKNDMTQAGASAGYVTVAVTPVNNFILQWDGDGNGFLEGNAAAGTTTYPVWLRLERQGTSFTGSYSTDGSTWQVIGSTEIPTAAATQDIGMFATSHASGQTGLVEYEGFTLDVPKLSASATPLAGEAPLRVRFTGESAYGAGEATYRWDFGDGTGADGLRAIHTYTEPGTYTATLTATETGGGISRDTVQIRVTSPCTTPFEAESGYRMLFDGTSESLESWHMAGPGSFEHDGCTIKSVGGLGLFWYDQEFTAPYSLKLEWMMPGDDNSGIFVGFPNPGTDPWVAVNEGEEIQIDATDDPDSTTGAIYNEQAADTLARDAALKPPGEWNEYEIRVEADRIIVFLNGVKINEWIDDDPLVDLATGYIGIQNHGSSGPGNPDDVFFRNIRINDGTVAPDTEPPDTRVDTGPRGKVKVNTATFGFSSTEQNSTFECALDGAAFAPCSSPATYADLAPGKHVFRVRATDAAGNTDPTPAMRSWSVG